MDARTNPYAVLMGKLTGINAPPKARQAFQQYMRESYDADIAPVVQARFATERDNIGHGSGATQKGPNAPFRARVARELFAELSGNEQQALRERAKLEAKGARDDYESRRKAPPSKKPEDRQKCIDNLGTFMAPILRGIEEYTGLHSVVIFGGPMPRHGGELRTVHVSHGRSQDGAHALFPQWAKGRFNENVLELMHEYLRAAFTPAQCAEAAMPVDEDGEPGASRAKGKALADLDSSSSSSSDSDEEGQQSDDSSNVTSEDEDNGAMKGGKERTKMEGKATAEPKVKQSGPKKIGGQRPGKERATEGAPSRKRKHGEQDEDEGGVGEGEGGSRQKRRGEKSGDVAARKRKRKSVGAKEESDEGITESGGNEREYSTAVAGRSSAEADVAAAKKKATTGKNSPPAAASGAGGGDGRNTNGHPPLSDTVSCLLGAAQWPTSSDRAPLWGSPESEPQTE